MQRYFSGTLNLTVVEAKLFRSVEVITKQDPYCIINYRGDTIKTKVAEDAGLSPVFNNSFPLIFEPSDIDEPFELQVYDRATLGSDTLIGFAPLKLSALLPNSDLAVKKFQDWFSIFYSNQRVGIVLLRSQYEQEQDSLGKEQYMHSVLRNAQLPKSDAEGMDIVEFEETLEFKYDRNRKLREDQ